VPDRFGTVYHRKARFNTIAMTTRALVAAKVCDVEPLLSTVLPTTAFSESVTVGEKDGLPSVGLSGDAVGAFVVAAVGSAVVGPAVGDAAVRVGVAGVGEEVAVARTVVLAKEVSAGAP